MKNYIGIKGIKARPMSYEEFQLHKTGKELVALVTSTPGYMVRYPDGYESWSPKDVFDEAYMQVGDNNSITANNVKQFIKQVDAMTLGEKTTLVKATLANGFEIVESSSCVDPSNYDVKMGTDICLNKIEDKVWELLGFALQWGIYGIEPRKTKEAPEEVINYYNIIENMVRLGFGNFDELEAFLLEEGEPYFLDYMEELGRYAGDLLVAFTSDQEYEEEYEDSDYSNRRGYLMDKIVEQLEELTTEQLETVQIIRG